MTYDYDQIHLCPYCGSQVRELQGCCGEVHGESHYVIYKPRPAGTSTLASYMEIEAYVNPHTGERFEDFCDETRVA